MSEVDFEALAELGVATVYEAAGREGLVDLPLIQLLDDSRVAGPARTVRCGQDDNLMVHAAMDVVRPGDVLVITMPDPTPVGLVGDLIGTQALNRGVAALLVDGAVRDVDELRDMGLPVWTRFVRATGVTRDVVGTIDEPVEVGNARISSGDIIVLDADGAVVVPADRITEVVKAARERQAKEDELRDQIAEGKLTYDLHGLRALVEQAQERR